MSVLGRAEHPKGLEGRRPACRPRPPTSRRPSPGSLHEGWLVDDGAGGWRAARLGDITVLVPGAHVPAVPRGRPGERRHRVPGRVELPGVLQPGRARPPHGAPGGRRPDQPSPHRLRPADPAARPAATTTCSAIHTSGAGAGATWPTQPDTVPADDPVLRCLQFLRALHDERNWLAPSELLGRIARERRAFELGFTEGRPRDSWRRLRFVIDQARAWSEATGGNLRQYLSWVSPAGGRGGPGRRGHPPRDRRRRRAHHDDPCREGSRVPDHDRLGHVHRAGRPASPPPRSCSRPRGVGYRFSGRVTTEEYEAWKPIDEQMGLDERIRLLYVACTRAWDHLVVSLHRKARAKDPKPTSRTNAELLVDGMGARLGRAARRLPRTRGVVPTVGRRAAPATAAVRAVAGRAHRRPRAGRTARGRSRPRH